MQNRVQKSLSYRGRPLAKRKSDKKPILRAKKVSIHTHWCFAYDDHWHATAYHSCRRAQKVQLGPPSAMARSEDEYRHEKPTLLLLLIPTNIGTWPQTTGVTALQKNFRRFGPFLHHSLEVCWLASDLTHRSNLICILNNFRSLDFWFIISNSTLKMACLARVEVGSRLKISPFGLGLSVVSTHA